jgi:hypothetical protein
VHNAAATENSNTTSIEKTNSNFNQPGSSHLQSKAADPENPADKNTREKISLADSNPMRATPDEPDDSKLSPLYIVSSSRCVD